MRNRPLSYIPALIGLLACLLVGGTNTHALSRPSRASDALSVWRIETVDDDGWVGLYSSLALDSWGQPHISYHDIGNVDLKYAYKDATGWHVETVTGSEGDVGSYSTSLALDSFDQPHISYYDDTGEKLMYASRLHTVFLPLVLRDMTGQAR